MPGSLSRTALRLAAGAAAALAIFATVTAPSAMAQLPSGSSGSGAAPTVELNAYCGQPGASGRLANGRAVYCTPIQGTNASVWSYTHGPLAHDPNTRGYSCDAGGCHQPDGTATPDYQRCGILCGEPPTSGDIQSGLSDCFDAGTAFEECEHRIH